MANDSVTNATIAGVLKPGLFDTSMNYMIYTPLATPPSSQATTAAYNGILVLSEDHSSTQAAQTEVLSLPQRELGRPEQPEELGPGALILGRLPAGGL